MKGIKFLNSLIKWDNKTSFGLSSIQKVLKILDNPQDKPKSIHIGGTNGKGTTSVAMASILGAAGFNVGLNTSPHLVRINERFIINGREADDSEISTAALVVKDAMFRAEVVLSYHEAITATAFVLFQNLDWIVIEVGLGGRLDASNVLAKPQVSIITSISLDHEAILGNSIASIAREKAGIIKNKSKLVIGQLPKDALDVISRVSNESGHAAFCQFGKDFSYKKLDKGIEFQSKFQTILIENYIYQNHTKSINDCLAMETAMLLGLDRHIESGILDYYWPGRYETIVFQNKKFLIDAAHNPASIDALIEYLSINYPQKNDFQIVFAALKTKDWKYFIDKLKSYIVHWHIVLADSDVAVSPAEIGEYLSCLGIKDFQLHGSEYEGVVLETVKSPSPITLVAGSMYMIGRVKSILSDQVNIYWGR